MSLGQIVLVGAAGAAIVFAGMLGTLIVFAKIDKWKAANGGRFPWEK